MRIVKNKIKSKGPWVLGGMIIGGLAGILNNLSTFIFLKDRHKQFKDEIKNVDEMIEKVSDKEVEQFKEDFGKDIKYVEDKEIKEKLGELKTLNNERKQILKRWGGKKDID